MPYRPHRLPWPLLLCGALTLAAQHHVASLSHHGAHGHGRISADRVSSQRRRDAFKNRLHNLHGQMHGVRTRIHENKVQENHITETLGVVETRIAQTRKDLLREGTLIETLDAQHETMVERLDKARNRLAQEKQVLSHRLLDNYQRRRATYIETLLGSASVHDMLSHAYLIRLIVRSDAELIGGIQKDARQIEDDRSVIEQQEHREQQLEAELEAQKTRFVEDAQKRRLLLHGVRAARVEAEQELDDLEAEASAMTDRIRILSAILLRQQEEALRAAKAAAKHTRKGHAVSGAVRLPAVWHGGFVRPCAGPLTSGFGVRFHPILHRFRMHTGVDFGAGYGSTIRAAAGGVVLLSAYNRGYGNCIILDHGGGVTTLYGHCSARLVREGQSVRQGQEIGRVGATGLATGPHLHFEVRHNGVPVAPY